MSRIMSVAVSFGILMAIGLACRADSAGKAAAEGEMAGFAGVLSHDFGDIPFSLPMEDLRHDFVLANTSGKFKRIRAIRASCGCLDATPSSMLIGPDETLRISAKIKISSAGIRTVLIHVIFDDGPILQLNAVVAAVPKRSVVVSHRAVLFRKDSGHRVVTIVATGMSETRPGPISWRSPSGLRVEELGWRQVFASDDDLLPARHELTLHLEAEHDRLFSSPLRVLVEGEEFTVGLLGWPWDDCAVVGSSKSHDKITGD